MDVSVVDPALATLLAYLTGATDSDYVLDSVDMAKEENYQRAATFNRLIGILPVRVLSVVYESVKTNASIV